MPRKTIFKETKRKKFTEEEDNLLRSLVLKYGTSDWNLIAEYMPERNGRQCRERYQNYLIPGFHNIQWTTAEDDLLHAKYIEYGPRWIKIKPFFPGRSANSLKNRWNYFVCRFTDLSDKAQEKDNISSHENDPSHDILKNDFITVENGIDNIENDEMYFDETKFDIQGQESYIVDDFYSFFDTENDYTQYMWY
ncbi:Myb-like DNA-binding domain containing protein [Tritrichomonas foetus]|uniref:Myb-like DNA-binding domain containing protein n=1 Tax=Tritrichomonas foetus TaxID=1144522 RepID=A0A1J4KA68_9EUKA|nr:Myb-like DNA-binding domain containing protein [Tritrichomonas foetus]|eukprot:OHT06349.1 Myb-like DNA-binding domain containing protein [Tritrichomonas foetus]